MGLLAPTVGRLYDRVGTTPLLVPGTIIVSAVLWALTLVDQNTPVWAVVTGHIVISLGLALVFTPGIVVWSEVWPWAKAAAVLGMTWFHHWLGWRRKDFMAGTNTTSGRHYRMMNEVPTVLMIVIVCSVIVKF